MTSSLRTIIPIVQSVGKAVKDLAMQFYILFTEGVDALPVDSALRLIVKIAQTAKDAFVALGTAVYDSVLRRISLARLRPLPMPSRRS